MNISERHRYETLIEISNNVNYLHSLSFTPNVKASQDQNKASLKIVSKYKEYGYCCLYDITIDIYKAFLIEYKDYQFDGDFLEIVESFTLNYILKEDSPNIKQITDFLIRLTSEYMEEVRETKKEFEDYMADVKQYDSFDLDKYYNTICNLVDNNKSIESKELHRYVVIVYRYDSSASSYPLETDIKGLEGHYFTKGGEELTKDTFNEDFYRMLELIELDMQDLCFESGDNIEILELK